MGGRGQVRDNNLSLDIAFFWRRAISFCDIILIPSEGSHFFFKQIRNHKTFMYVF